MDVVSQVTPSSLLQKITNKKLILPFYHTIADKELPHINGLYPIKSSKAFEKDLDFLLKHYKPIDYPEFKKLQVENKQAKKPSFLLSFDDGLSEFSDVIAPILIRKGIPAICFLNSDFIDNKALFFRYKASLLIHEFNKNAQIENELKNKFFIKGELKKHILAIKFNQKGVLDKMADCIDLDFDIFLEKEKPYLTSEQINSLINQGFYFGAHSKNHPEYQYISFEEQISQTQESLDFIVKNFNLDYKIFSLPFTDFKVSKAFFERINEEANLDYTFGCAGIKQDSIENHFQRIAFEQNDFSAQRILDLELLYYLFKIPFGKNKLTRL